MAPKSKDKIVSLKLKFPGIKRKTIQSVINCSLRTIDRITNYYKNFENSEIEQSKVKKIRKSKLTNQQKLYIVQLFLRKPFLRNKDAIFLLNLNVSTETIRKTLSENGIKSRRAAIKPLLVLEYKLQRLTQATTWLNLSFSFWKKVLFTDEKTFQSFPNGVFLVKRKNGERYNSKNIIQVERQNKFSLNLYCLISYNGPNKLIVAKKNMTGIDHLNMLENNGIIDFLIEKNYTFQQDNASVHNLFKKFINDYNESVTERSRIKTLENWPPKSPDLNPVENVWAQLQYLLNQKLREITISNETELERKIYDCWDQLLETNFIKDCIKTMPIRLKQVIEMDGGSTRF